MYFLSDLRARVAFFFALFGALVSLIMAVAIHQGAHDLSQRLIDETLSAELDDYIARRERNPLSLPPSTVTLQGYVIDAQGDGVVPEYLRPLPQGRHDIDLGGLRYRVVTVERGGERYYLMSDTTLQARREGRFAWMLGLMVLIMTLFSALGGAWLPRMVVAPVVNLAAKVRHRSPTDWEHPLADDFPSGEVGELARVFDRQLTRMRAFIERERAFSGDISHELRTALAVILSTTEVMFEDADLNEPQRRRILRIERAARDMAELGTVIMLLSKEDASLAPAGGCPLAETVCAVVEKQRYLLSGKPVDVVVQTNSETYLQADPGLVEILISNLVRNAFSYTSSGVVSVLQDAHSLIVADTGKGIPGHALDQVFIRHFRDVASAGAGIGLSLVKRICDRYGWQVHLESTSENAPGSVENRGTTIRVLFDGAPSAGLGRTGNG